MTRAALYSRVSTEEQTGNHSLDVQDDKLTALADQLGLSVVRRYVDGGHSGAKRERPALTDLLADAQDGAFETVLIYRLDRLARSTHLAYSLVKDLADAGVGVRSYSEPQIDSTTPMGKVSLGVTAIFAELERDTFMQRSRDGTRRALQQGTYVGGIIAYGYTRENKRLVIQPEEAEVVRMVFGWCVERGWSTIKIAEELTRLNIPTRYRLDGRGVRGKATATYWRGGGVLRLLKNSTYKGEYHYGKRNMRGQSGKHGIVVVPCPAIVTPEVWEAAQQTLARNALTAMRHAKHVYMLRGLIKCGACGKTYVGSWSEAWNGYRCNGRWVRGSTPKAVQCHNPNLKASDIELHVWERIRSVLLDPEQHLIEQPLTLIPAELPRAQKALADAQGSRARLTDLYLDPNGALSKAEYLTRLSKIDAQVSALQKQVAGLQDEDARLKAQQDHARELRDLSKRYRERLDEADDTLKQLLAHHFARRITVQQDGSVDVDWRF